MTWDPEVIQAQVTAAELADARRLLRSVEDANRAKKRSNAAVRQLWAAWDAVADRLLGVDR